ncbi:cobalamin B12-binding domain-containing protein [Acuticoccus kandeliae]|uniref:cobalamin B12-binding domain-containing protein n=1 Tax=Acuticoccus kandeliae TaxID=2073160 RepID=UPI0013005F10|nr:cobalamin B12-binding domain-containing protein [Acuticoccus kandeliae]
MNVTELAFGESGRENNGKSGFSTTSLTCLQLDRPDRLGHLKALTRTIEGEIIPRLLLVHSKAEISQPQPQDQRRIVEADIETITKLVLSSGPSDCIRHVERVQEEGISLQTIFLDLFAPSARRLGVLWAEDIRSFTDVTIALGTLQQVFHHFSHAFTEISAAFGGRRAFLVPAPGEQHTFGLFMIETFLYRAGWQVDTVPSFSVSEVQAFLAQNPVQLIAISASSERAIEGTSLAIGMMRGESRLDDVVIMAGGSPFNASPSLVQQVGADGTAEDARAAVTKADRLVPKPVGDEHRRPIN